jgi:hypothetical protein
VVSSTGWPRHKKFLTSLWFHPRKREGKSVHLIGGNRRKSLQPIIGVAHCSYHLWLAQPRYFGSGISAFSSHKHLSNFASNKSYKKCVFAYLNSTTLATPFLIVPSGAQYTIFSIRFCDNTQGCERVPSNHASAQHHHV